MRLLVVEDYPPVRAAVTTALRDEGYAVDTVGDGHDAWGALSGGSYDAVILDVMLPGIDGLEVLRRVRKAEIETQVLLLTARDEVEDRVRGLDAGADDYLVKPFAVEELVARVRSLLRRHYGKQDPVLTFGHVQLDTNKKEVRVSGAAIELTAREYGLFEYLALRAGEVVSRSDIWEHVYDEHSETTSNVVDVYVGYLRKKIERKDQPKLIHTRRGIGYVLKVEPR